jgi:hypothetical protein
LAAGRFPAILKKGTCVGVAALDGQGIAGIPVNRGHAFGCALY